ncbi:hypothetical protein [Nocardioides sp. Root151]|uniref:hypothetical protein n=1 Tax=Nocardioides sp. Root151 TaxID=1736475 RepID=UPI0007037B22|nr:hypothetical protein [Nocardioides sp. Root151]KQZ67416.1 hypothetical protein ASD66_20955 [Nocardioides sp. Root151]
MRKRLKIWGAALCLCLGAAPVLDAGASAGHADRGPGTGTFAVSGTGGGTLELPRYEGDIVSFRVRASAPSDAAWTATGSFDVTHVRPDGTVLADFSGTVDCLMVGAGVAVVTGIITKGGAAGIPGEELGRRVGLTVSDHGRRDHLGWSWLVTGFHDVTPCTSTAPFFPVTEGNFSVDAR